MRELVSPHVAELTRCVNRAQKLQKEYQRLVERINRLQGLIEQDGRRMKLDVQRSTESGGDGV